MERWAGGHHCDVHSDLSLREGFSLNFSNGPKSVIFKAGRRAQGQKNDENARKKKDRCLSTPSMERWAGGHPCDVHSDLSLREGFSLNFSNGPKSVIFKAGRRAQGQKMMKMQEKKMPGVCRPRRWKGGPVVTIVMFTQI
jgi:hypothetical protein